MKLEDIYVRDPFILSFNGIYYLYSKVSQDARGFIVYRSRDLKEWSEPKTVFTPSEDFWGKYDFWAPEVHMYRNKFYMFASFNSDSRLRGTHILRADKPDGEFIPISDEPITPKECASLDGTLYVDNNGEPHIVFCHEWAQIGDGTVCEMKLSSDLTKALSEPRVLWKASDFAGSVDAAADGRLSLVTDGPFLFKTEQGELYSTWSTMGKDGYLVCLSKSSNGDIDGEWTVLQEPLYCKDGGHGMVFKNEAGEDCFVIHGPNVHPMERAHIFTLNRKKGFVLEEKCL